MLELHGLPSPGQIGRARAPRCLLEDAFPPPTPESHTRVHLAPLEDDAQGAALERPREREIDAVSLSGTSEGDSSPPGILACFTHPSAAGSNVVRERRTEPARFRRDHDVRARRVEPAGGVFLWPVTG